jgi:uncharacterized protein (DUF433 family)
MKNRPSSVPLYAPSELARYSRARAPLVHRLFEGYAAEGRAYPPLLHGASRDRDGFALLSFENLIETALIVALRSRRISMQSIRAAHRAAGAEFGEHPFARRPVFVAGHDIFMQADQAVTEERHVTALTQGGQRALRPVLEQYLKHVRWDEDWPVEWQPQGGVVRQNPEIQFGLPQVKAVRTEIIRSRFQAEESVTELATDFDLSADEVEQALRYEFWLRPAA